MALLEASSKFFTAIHKRLHKSQKEEFKILARIDSESLPQRYPYDVPGESSEIFRMDFDDKIDIIPVSDPNIPSSAHRLMMTQMAMQLAQNAPPGMFNMEELNRTFLTQQIFLILKEYFHLNLNHNLLTLLQILKQQLKVYLLRHSWVKTMMLIFRLKQCFYKTLQMVVIQ